MKNKLVTSINELIKKYHLYAFKDVAIFMIILLVFHVLWKIFVNDILSVAFITSSGYWLAHQVYLGSRWFLELVNVNVVAFDEFNIGGALRKNVFYHAENNGYVAVNLSCSGIKQFYQWFFLIALYPGPWKHKLWFFPLGLGIIHIVNIIRIVGMVYVTIYLPDNWHFMHDYVARPFFYVVMFLLWVWWNEKFYLKSKKSQ
ncbi:MAG: exosortase/archaeosortase family protein [Bacteroidales bacterium]|nr:exosortase/archaeosortase family protein [Bacteroidales bacterium]MCF8403196.1 exosortase/archaeosortase family protein [Bacteroidales bacterium]